MADTDAAPNRARVFAPAKVNLCLHITGQRDDGYHVLDSIVSFGSMGDGLRVGRANTLSLTLEGPEAADLPADMDNLVLKAASLFASGEGYAFTLTKELPMASGVGGGSADAAAAARAVLALQEAGGVDLSAGTDETLRETGDTLLKLGADIPMCLLSRPARVRGIGERVDFLPLGQLPVVLVNPRVQVSTPAVFKSLARKTNPGLPNDIPKFANASDCIAWLTLQRNDLEAPALAVAPSIGDVLDALSAQEACGLARMSGSGATCFGLFPTHEAAHAAAQRLYRDRPEWWVAAGVLADQSKASVPILS